MSKSCVLRGVLNLGEVSEWGHCFHGGCNSVCIASVQKSRDSALESNKVGCTDKLEGSVPWSQSRTLGADCLQRYSHRFSLLCPRDSLRELKIWGVQIASLQRERAGIADRVLVSPSTNGFGWVSPPWAGITFPSTVSRQWQSTLYPLGNHKRVTGVLNTFCSNYHSLMFVTKTTVLHYVYEEDTCLERRIKVCQNKGT